MGTQAPETQQPRDRGVHPLGPPPCWGDDRGNDQGRRTDVGRCDGSVLLPEHRHKLSAADARADQPRACGASGAGTAELDLRSGSHPGLGRTVLILICFGPRGSQQDVATRRWGLSGLSATEGLAPWRKGARDGGGDPTGGLLPNEEGAIPSRTGSTQDRLQLSLFQLEEEVQRPAGRSCSACSRQQVGPPVLQRAGQRERRGGGPRAQGPDRAGLRASAVAVILSERKHAVSPQRSGRSTAVFMGSLCARRQSCRWQTSQHAITGCPGADAGADRGADIGEGMGGSLRDGWILKVAPTVFQ